MPDERAGRQTAGAIAGPNLMSAPLEIFGHDPLR